MIDTIGSFNYTQDNAIKLTIFDKILWPWGYDHPTDQKTCADDQYDCPENEMNGRSTPGLKPIS